MLIFDELKKNDPQLRLVAIGLAAGLFILLVGLWWVQVASAGEYESHLQTQSYRTVRVPAMRGKILDCEGRVMAENGASYNLSLYLGDLTGQFQTEEKTIAPGQSRCTISSILEILGAFFFRCKKRFPFQGRNFRASLAGALRCGI